jgi:ribosomal protein L23
MGRPRLTLSVEASAGDSLVEAMVAMLGIAQRTGARVEMKGNGYTFWVEPDDTEYAIRAAFERCYLLSGEKGCVATWIYPRPVIREPTGEKS